MHSSLKIALVSLLLVLPALIFWVWLMMQAIGVMMLCPSGCWCEAETNNVDCTSGGLKNIPASFETNIFELTLDDNHFNILKEDIFLTNGLKELNVLSMRNCYISSVVPGAFNGLMNLTFLSLTNNLLYELKPYTFENLPHLNSLFLSGNQIETLTSGIFIAVTNLTFINLNDNNIRYIHADVFQNATNLEELHISYNYLINIPENRSFLNIPTLKFLYISNCNIRYVSGITFANTSDLRILDLGENKLKNIDMNILVTLPKLSSLLIYKNPLECDCRLKEVWLGFKENSLMSTYYNQEPTCDSPEEVRGLWWDVFKQSHCLNGELTYYGNFEDISKKYVNTQPEFNNINYIHSVLHNLFFTFGATGNLVLIIVIMFNKEMRTVPNMYILNLAVSDLLSLTTSVSQARDYVSLKPWKYGEHMCKLHIFVSRLSIGLSAYSVALLSIQRYKIMVRPLQNRFHSTTTWRVTVVNILVVWILAIVFALPSTVDGHVNNYCSHYLSRSYYKNVVIFELLVSCVLPLCVIAFMYITTARHLAYDTVPMIRHIEHPQANSRMNIAKIVLGLTVIFVISYVPYHIIWAYLIWFDYPHGPDMLLAVVVSSCLLVFNSCFNPVALFCSSNAYRRILKHCVLCYHLRKMSPSSSSTANNRTCHQNTQDTEV